jgi:hypothetical protein
MSISDINITFVVHSLIVAILIGMFYVIWITTKAYGGVIGRSLRLFGFGILFISIAVIEKMLINFTVLPNTAEISLVQDVFTLTGLIILAFGFTKLAAASRV